MMNLAPAAAKMSAMPHLLALGNRPMPRSILSPVIRADSSNPAAMLAEINKDFQAFKEAHTEALKKHDVVTEEKVERVNAAVGAMQTKFDEYTANAKAALDELNAKLAAAQMGGGGVGDVPADPEYLGAYKAWMRKGNVSAAMDKGTDQNGGYLTPIEWDRSLTGRLKLVSPIRANARVVRISVAGFKKLFTDRAVGSGWVGETASRPATSTPQIGTLDFVPGELYANPAISQQLLDDSAINLEDWLGEEVEFEFARQEGIAFLSGDGANKPFGILTYVTGGANAAKHPWGAIPVTPSGAAAALTGDGFIDLMYSLPGAFAANAKLYINRLSLGAARKLKDGQGNYLWQPAYQQGQPQTLNGSPIVEVPDMPVVAAGNIAALYGDMAATYQVIDRIGISVLRDPYTNKPYVQFYTVKRVGGGLYNPEPMRALKISAT